MTEVSTNLRILFFGNNLQVKKKSIFSKNCEKLFLSEKKSDFNFENREYFVKKNVPKIC